MKNISIFLVLFLFFFSCGKKEVKKENPEPKKTETEQTVPQEQETESKEIAPELIYTVQIAALRKQNEFLLSIDGIKTYDENGLTKYRLGNFETYEEARELRTRILEEFNDAFIQALKNNTPISIQEALKN